MLLVVVLIVSMLSIAITPIVHSVFILSVAGKPTRLTVVMLNAVAPTCASTTDPELIKQRTLKNIKNCWNTNIYSYFLTSGGESSKK
jgi:hypothetical protein